LIIISLPILRRKRIREKSDLIVPKGRKKGRRTFFKKETREKKNTCFLLWKNRALFYKEIPPRETPLGDEEVEILVDFLRRSWEFIKDKSESTPFPFPHPNIESISLHTIGVRKQLLSVLTSLGINRKFFLNTPPPQDCEETEECSGYLGEISLPNTENFNRLLREKGAFLIVNRIREELLFSLSPETSTAEALH